MALPTNIKTRLERLARNKQPSLLRKSVISYVRKFFIRLPQASIEWTRETEDKVFFDFEVMKSGTDVVQFFHNKLERLSRKRILTVGQEPSFRQVCPNHAPFG
jgi:hypothetical protein